MGAVNSSSSFSVTTPPIFFSTGSEFEVQSYEQSITDWAQFVNSSCSVDIKITPIRDCAGGIILSRCDEQAVQLLRAAEARKEINLKYVLGRTAEQLVSLVQSISKVLCARSAQAECFHIFQVYERIITCHRLPDESFVQLHTRFSGYVDALVVATEQLSAGFEDFLCYQLIKIAGIPHVHESFMLYRLTPVNTPPARTPSTNDITLPTSLTDQGQPSSSDTDSSSSTRATLTLLSLFEEFANLDLILTHPSSIPTSSYSPSSFYVRPSTSLLSPTGTIKKKRTDQTPYPVRRCYGCGSSKHSGRDRPDCLERFKKVRR